MARKRNNKSQPKYGPKNQPYYGPANKPKPKKAPQQGKARPNWTARASLPRSVHSVCGLTDPFCTHAIGAKYPDDSSARTLTYSRHGRSPLVTDASGNLRYLWYPQWSTVPITSALSGTFPSVTAWNYFAVDTPIANVVGYRIVSSGFIIRCVVSPLNAAGELSLRSHANLSGIGAVDVQSYNATASSDQPLRLVDNLVSVSSHTSAMPQLFYNPGLDALDITVAPSNGFNPITIAATGCLPTAAVMSIEWVVHYELIFDDSAGLSQACTPPPPANLAVTSAANRVTSMLPTFFNKGAKALGDVVIRHAATALGSFLGGPAGGAAARSSMAMLVD